ncbi:MAG: hypothetical protein H6522_05835 [Mycolicibacterium sp.]|nr:hypothetical protein [Mycolicibacterium sp.]
MARLAERGFKVGAVQRPRPDRRKALKAFRAPATSTAGRDVAARGIDIDEASHVISCRSPGTTGLRAPHQPAAPAAQARCNIAITLVDWDELDRWSMIDKALKLVPDPQDLLRSPLPLLQAGHRQRATGSISLRKLMPGQVPGRHRISSADAPAVSARRNWCRAPRSGESATRHVKPAKPAEAGANGFRSPSRRPGAVRPVNAVAGGNAQLGRLAATPTRRLSAAIVALDGQTRTPRRPICAPPQRRAAVVAVVAARCSVEQLHASHDQPPAPNPAPNGWRVVPRPSPSCGRQPAAHASPVVIGGTVVTGDSRTDAERDARTSQNRWTFAQVTQPVHGLPTSTTSRWRSTPTSGAAVRCSIGAPG